MIRAFRAVLIIGAVVCATCAGVFIATTPSPRQAEDAISIAVGREVGVVRTRLGTQFVWTGGLERPEARGRFNALAPPLVRINATTVGAPTLPVVLPAGIRRGDWHFDNLDSIVRDIRRGGGQVVLTVAYAPEWMWSCPAGTIRDPSFAEFAEYMADLVGYYNVGFFVAEDGRTIRNPAGAANRIEYWELWNEPDQPTLGCPPTGNPNISAGQYLKMWNAAVPRMLVVDPAIKLVGPATSSALTGSVPEYIPTLVAGAVRRPDIVSFHAYGGWKNSQSDQFLFAGGRGCCGLESIGRGVDRVRTWAPGIPVWVTELNVNSAWDEEDPSQRSWTSLGVAWGASAFRRLVLAEAEAGFQYKFVHQDLRQFSLIEASTARPLLPYWRDYYLARYFPPGSVILDASSPDPDTEVLAARPPDSKNVRVLVVNRRTNAPGAIGGPGVPMTVQVRMADLKGLTAVTARLMDAATPLDTGPTAIELPAATSVTVSLAGYAVALIEFVCGSPQVSGA
jgi:hypothetical protein